MNVAADLQQVRSLAAMSRALRASRSSAQTLVEIRTSVVRDMLNARYYNGTQGQFTSQDPVFLVNPSQQNLQDPQSLNSYSYSDDNPITKSDPNGKFGAIAMAPAYALAPEELLSGPIGWGLLGLTAIGTGVILAENAPRVQPTAPGYPQAFQESIGQGYNPDPEFGGKNSPPGWGTVGKVIFWTGVGSYVGCQFVDCDLEGAPKQV